MTYVEPSDAPMTVFEAIYSLRATRIYEDRPVPPEILDQVLQAGTMACSSGNTQPWEFLLVTDADLKRRIKVEMAEAFVAVAADRVQKPEDLIDGAGRPVTGHDAVENIDKVPAIVVVCWNPERGVRFKGEYEENPDGTLTATREIPGGRGVSLFQACQNMLLAGRSLGLSSLFATFFFLRNDEIKEILGIPPHIFMECCLFFGYADEKLGRPRRKPLSEIAHVNQWGTPYEITAP
ncbi:MAG: putative oxidoreductase [Actinomycetia bacterium]|nr:putative oxidoreductase [Actinomycetes bacterium]